MKSLSWLLQTVHDLEPLLYWLHEDVPAEGAKKYFLYLQELFIGQALDVLDVNRKLISGLDDLLRMMHVEPFRRPDGSYNQYDYSAKKIANAYDSFYNYFSDVGMMLPIDGNRMQDVLAHSTDELLEILYPNLIHRARILGTNTTPQAVLVNLSVQLVCYLKEIRIFGEYQAMDDDLMGAIKALIALVLHTMGVEIPPSGGTDVMYDVRSYGLEYWKDIL